MEDRVFSVYVSVTALCVAVAISLWVGKPMTPTVEQTLKNATTTALVGRSSLARLNDARLATEREQDAQLARGVEVRGASAASSSEEHESKNPTLPRTHTTNVLTPIVSKKTAAPAQSVAPQATIDLLALSQRIHELTNAERAKEGLAALSYDTTLARNARRYSESMQKNNLLSHTDLLGCNMTCRFSRDRYIALAWGENLARWRSSYAPSLEEVATYFVREWKKSSGHRENLLSETFTQEGIGVAMDGNEIYVTVHFAEPNKN